MDTRPIYIILLLLLIFVFLWYFLGEQEFEFVGLKPLLPGYITEDRPGHREVRDEDVESKERELEFNTVRDESAVDICVDLTPQLPPEFVTTVCFPDKSKYLSKGEKVCRETMERIYALPFTNQRPGWLKNITGHSMELDCYNDKLKLAVEYNGEQHYKWPNRFNRHYNEFKDQLRRDKLKKELCEREGVHLIVVPYNIQYQLIPTYIMRHLPGVLPHDDITDTD